MAKSKPVPKYQGRHWTDRRRPSWVSRHVNRVGALVVVLALIAVSGAGAALSAPPKKSGPVEDLAADYPPPAVLHEEPLPSMDTPAGEPKAVGPAVQIRTVVQGPDDQVVDDLNYQIYLLTQQLNGALQRTSAAEQKSATLQDQLTTVQGQVTDLTTKLTDLQTLLDELNDRLDALETVPEPPTPTPTETPTP